MTLTEIFYIYLGYLAVGMIVFFYIFYREFGLGGVKTILKNAPDQFFVISHIWPLVLVMRRINKP